MKTTVCFAFLFLNDQKTFVIHSIHFFKDASNKRGNRWEKSGSSNYEDEFEEMKQGDNDTNDSAASSTNSTTSGANTAAKTPGFCLFLITPWLLIFVINNPKQKKDSELLLLGHCKSRPKKYGWRTRRPMVALITIMPGQESRPGWSRPVRRTLKWSLKKKWNEWLQ